MNLSEMNKQKTMVSTDMTQLMPISHDTIDKWKKLSQEQAEALSKVTAERDELRSEKGSGKYPEMSGADAGTSGKRSENLIRKSEAARRASKANRGKSETANRIVQNAEYQSVSAEKQRRSAEQERIAEQERARAARRKNKRRSGPEL